MDLNKIEVLEYSPKQKCYHTQSLFKHLQSNYNYPDNEYFMIDGYQNIPDEILQDKEHQKYLRIGTLINVATILKVEKTLDRAIESARKYKQLHDADPYWNN